MIGVGYAETIWCNCESDQQDTTEESVIMSIGKTRSALYKTARILGDVNAVKRGTIGKRIVRRAAGRATGRGLGKLFK
jgi:predicted GNAT family N-acyltransferase